MVTCFEAKPYSGRRSLNRAISWVFSKAVILSGASSERRTFVVWSESVNSPDFVRSHRTFCRRPSQLMATRIARTMTMLAAVRVPRRVCRRRNAPTMSRHWLSV